MRSLSLCGALDPDELSALDRLSRPLSLSARETIFEQDELADSVFNITAGSARLYRLLPDGRRQIVGFALPGDFLGLAMSERNAFSADALTPLTACQFSRAAFSDFLDEKPHLLRKLHSMASHELSLAQEQMVIFGRRTAEEKVASFLIGLRKRWARLSSARHDTLADDPAGHRRLPRPHGRDRQPHADAARAREGDSDRARRRAAARCRAHRGHGGILTRAGRMCACQTRRIA